MELDKNKISAIINTYNASEHISRTLESLKAFDEIVVCDMESTDNTCHIARQYGARIVTFPKGNHNICEPARDFAIHSASYPWVLVVDADEAVSESLADYLYKYISSPHCADALSIPFKSMFMGAFISTVTERHVRFFRQSKAFWPPTIHSKVKIDGNIARVPAHRGFDIIHFDDPSLNARINKLNRYSDNEVEKRLGRHYSALAILFRPWWFFFKMLVMKGGIRDGKRGIIRAYMEMMYQVALLGKHIENSSKNDT